MRVRDVMTKRVSTCRPDSTLEEAIQTMEREDCGFLPVIGEGGNVIGVITDRDISISLGTRNRKASELTVWEVMPSRLFTCTADDDIHSVLTTMRISAVRRLPVIDREGTTVGVVSIDDIVLHARAYGLLKDVSYKDVEDTYKAICGHARQHPLESRAAA